MGRLRTNRVFREDAIPNRTQSSLAMIDHRIRYFWEAREAGDEDLTRAALKDLGHEAALLATRLDPLLEAGQLVSRRMMVAAERDVPKGG